MLKPEEIERRLPVWVALSDLFLDAEFDEATCRHVAERLRNSGFRLQEIEDILRDEVAPAFFPNLVVAGEWAGWTAEQVRDVVLRHIETQTTVPSLVARMRRRWHQWKTAPIAQDWEKVKALMAR